MKALDFAQGRIEAAHGSGGRASAQLVDELFAPAFDNPQLAVRGDAAYIESGAGRLVVSCDSHVVTPLFFPGGDIGSLAVHGTINDVAMAGGQPFCLSAAFILEEGFALAELRRIVDSMARAAKAAGVPIITGDTKVVEAGHADGVFITTTGTGVATEEIELRPDRARPGDQILLSGFIGDHGIAVLSQREGFSLGGRVLSDSAALHRVVARLLAAAPHVRVLRDPTRGGIAAALNEIAHAAGVGMCLDEEAIPIREPVAAACELLGLDPLYIANEGKLIAVCPPAEAEAALSALRQQPLAAHAAIIGEVTEGPSARVQMRTRFGSHRLVDWLAGDQLPRIC